MLLLLRGKDETPDMEEMGSVLRNSSIQALRHPTQTDCVTDPELLHWCV